MAVNFYIDKRLNKDGGSPLRISWTFKGQRVMTTMGYTVKPHLWDSELQKVQESNDINEGQFDAFLINQRLIAIRSSLMRIERVVRTSSLRPMYKEEMTTIVNRLLASLMDEMDGVVRSVALSWNVNLDEQPVFDSNANRTVNELLSELMDMILDGEIESKSSSCDLFGGASVIITDTPINNPHPADTIVLTNSTNARALSCLMYELRDRFAKYIPNERALFYTRLAKAANRYLESSDDTKGLLLSVYADLALYIIAWNDIEYQSKIDKIRDIIS